MLYWLRSSAAIWSKAALELVDLVADVDHAAAGLLGKLPHFAFAGVTKPAVEAAIGAEQDVHDGVGFLGGLDGILNA